MVKEGLEALYCLSMHDLLFKMVPLNDCFYKKMSFLIVHCDTALFHIPYRDLLNVFSTRLILLKFSYVLGFMCLFCFLGFKYSSGLMAGTKPSTPLNRKKKQSAHTEPTLEQGRILKGLGSYLFNQYHCLHVNRVYAEINTFLPPFSKKAVHSDDP